MESASDGGFAFSACDRFNWRQYFYHNFEGGQIVSYDNSAECLDGGLNSVEGVRVLSFQQCDGGNSNQNWRATRTGKVIRQHLTPTFLPAGQHHQLQLQF